MPKLGVPYCESDELTKLNSKKSEKKSPVFNVIGETLTESVKRVNFVPKFLETGNSCAQTVYVPVNGNPS